MRLHIGATLVLLTAISGCSQMPPSHEIRPKPDYIRAGLEPGDPVEITTKTGEHREFIVKSVGTDTIEGESETIRFDDIETLVKRSWKEPAHPCGAGKPVGCSIPEVILILSQEYADQARKFHKACVIHDFCYRHGFATYGASREACDSQILEGMKDACSGKGGLGLLDVKDYGICQLAATQTYEAIRGFGEKHYLTTASTYCEYR